MTYEIYRYIFYGGAVLAVVMLILSVVLFIVLRIPNVIGDLTGANARKAIENIRNQNESSGDKVYKTSAVNRERGKLTDKISPSGKLIPRETDPETTTMGTEKIGTQQLFPEAGNETAVLSAGETSVLAPQAGETAVLDQSEEETAAFEIEYEITFIHTEEVIA